MDGDLSDWDLLPAEYNFDLEKYTQHKEQTSLEHNPADLNIVRAAAAWNDELNRLYFMAEVYDDVVRFHKEDPDSLDHPFTRLTGSYVHGADIFEIVIDADHGAERVVGFSENDERELRYRSAFTQNYHLYMPPAERLLLALVLGQAAVDEGGSLVRGRLELSRGARLRRHRHLRVLPHPLRRPAPGRAGAERSPRPAGGRRHRPGLVVHRRRHQRRHLGRLLEHDRRRQHVLHG